MIPFALIVPLPLVIYGLANQFIDGTPGLVTCLVCLFVNGIGVSLIHTAIFTSSHSCKLRLKWHLDHVQRTWSTSCIPEVQKPWLLMGLSNPSFYLSQAIPSLHLTVRRGLRSALVASGISVVLPMINTFGIAITNSIFAILVWIAFGYFSPLSWLFTSCTETNVF